MKKVTKFALSLALIAGLFSFTVDTANAASDSEYRRLPSGYGKLTSNAWRSGLKRSGNTYKFNYTTSAIYSGSKKVDYIKTSWETCASLRKGASLSIGVNRDGVSASSSSSWQNKCKSAYWHNSNGAKGAYSQFRNAVIKPRKDYRWNSVTIQNEAKLRLKGDRRVWAVNASV